MFEIVGYFYVYRDVTPTQAIIVLAGLVTLTFLIRRQFIRARAAKQDRREMRGIVTMYGGKLRTNNAWGVDAPRGARNFVRIGDVFAYKRHAHQGVTAELGIDVGRLSIRPTTLADDVIETLGGQDLKVPSARFNETFRVKAERPDAARALLKDPMVDFLLERPQFSYELDGELLRVEADIPGPALRQWVERALGFCERIPPELRKDYPAASHV